MVAPRYKGPELLVLLARIRDGDRRAEDQVVRSFEDLVHRIATMYVHRGAMHYDDLCQELRMQMCQAVRKFDSDRGAPLVTYLWRCLANRAKDLVGNRPMHTRGPVARQSPVAAVDCDVDAGGPSDWEPGYLAPVEPDQEVASDLQRMREAFEIADLSTDERRVLTLMHFAAHVLTAQETAEKIGVSRQRVDQIRESAIYKLRGILT